MGGGTKGASAVLALVFLTLATARSSAESAPPRAAVLVDPARIELAVKPSDESIAVDVIVMNTGAQREQIDLALADFVIRSEAYNFEPPGSTPWTLASDLQVTTKNHEAMPLQLEPKQRAVVRLIYSPPAERSRVLAGALMVSPSVLDDGSSGAASGSGIGVSIRAQIAIPIIAVPAGSDGKLAQSVRLRGSAAGFSLPILAEGGPMLLQASVRNSGDAIARADTWFQLSNLGREFLSVEAPPAVALPGQTARSSASTKISAQGISTDTLPLFCICHVQASSRFVLLGEFSEPVQQSAWVIVAPWRILGLILAIISGVWWGRRRASLKDEKAGD